MKTLRNVVPGILGALLFLVACQNPLQIGKLPAGPAIAVQSRGIVNPSGAIFIGDGYNVISDTLVGNAFTSFTPMLALTQPGSTASYKYIDTDSHLNLFMKYDIDAGVGTPDTSSPFSINMSAKASFSNTFDLKSNSKLFVARIKYVYGDVYVDSPVLKPEALSLYQNSPDTFRQTYGDGFRSKATLGTELDLVFQLSGIDFSNTTDVKLESNISAAVLAIAAHDNSTFAANMVATSQVSSVSVSVNTVGAFVPPAIDPNNFASLVQCVDAFTTYSNQLASQGDLTRFGVIKFAYTKYSDLINTNAEAAFQKYMAWLELESHIRYVRNDTTDAVLRSQCDDALITVSQEKNKCISSPTTASFPLPGQFQSIISAWTTSQARSIYPLYVPQAGYNSIVYIVSKPANLYDDVLNLRQQMQRQDIVLQGSAYNFPVYPTPSEGSIAIYEVYKDSVLLTSNPDAANLKLINQGYTPFLGKRVLAYVRPSDSTSFPAITAFLSSVQTTTQEPIVKILQRAQTKYVGQSLSDAQIDSIRSTIHSGGNVHGILNSWFISNPVARKATIDMYQKYLNRMPSEAEITYWANQWQNTTGLDAQGYPTIDWLGFNRNFVDSSEFFNVVCQANYTKFVTELYRRILGREPDSGGLQNWVNALNQGTSKTSVINGFLNSGEMNGKYMTELYQRYLDRQPDSTGFATWTQALANHSRSHVDALMEFLQSPEFTNLAQQ